MLKLNMSKIEALYKALAAQQSLYLPIEKNDKVDYWRWAEGEDVRLTVQNTDKSPKNLFFPQLENMVAFNVEGKSIEIIEQELSKEKFVLMGVRACDARSLRAAGSRVPGRAGRFVLCRPPRTRHRS